MYVNNYDKNLDLQKQSKADVHVYFLQTVGAWTPQRTAM